MAKYNETKLQALLADRLLTDLGIVVNSKTLSVLLDKTENSMRQFLTRMSPSYFIPYADTNRTYGCTFKYRACTKKAERVLNKLSYRLLTNSHLNLRKRAHHIDYSDFYIFKGIDNFKDVFDIDIRTAIMNYNAEQSVTFPFNYDNDLDYKEVLPRYPNIPTSDFILNNNNWYCKPDNNKIKELQNKKSVLIRALKECVVNDGMGYEQECDIQEERINLEKWVSYLDRQIDVMTRNKATFC